MQLGLYMIHKDVMTALKRLPVHSVQEKNLRMLSKWDVHNSGRRPMTLGQTFGAYHCYGK